MRRRTRYDGDKRSPDAREAEPEEAERERERDEHAELRREAPEQQTRERTAERGEKHDEAQRCAVRKMAQHEDTRHRSGIHQRDEERARRRRQVQRLGVRCARVSRSHANVGCGAEPGR
jgi:hypothetical protein